MVKIKFRDQIVDLQKNEKYIGIKPEENQAESLQQSNALDGLEAVPEKLGGFELFATPDDMDAGAKLDELRQNDAVSLGTRVYQVDGNADETYVPTGDLYIVFRKGAAHKKCVNLLEQFHLHVKEVRGPRELIARVSPASPNPIKVAEALQAETQIVEICEPDLAFTIKQHGLNMPNDVLFFKQWYLRNTGIDPVSGSNWGLKEGADAKVVDAWNFLGNMGSPNVTISVVDDGFDLNHPDFQGKIVAPIDFETGSRTTLLRRAEDTHGTNCAGVALAANNGSGIVGVAPNARFMPVRTYGLDDTLIEQLFDYVSKNGADVMSNSWGISSRFYTTRTFNAIRKAATQGRKGRGMSILFAAGNDSATVANLATHPDVICVGASSSLDKHASYSNTGKEICVVAPSNGDGGLGVITTDIGVFTDEDGHLVDGGIMGSLYRDDFGGTSSACPLVAGVVALLYSANPNLTSAEVKRILQVTADKIGNSTDYGPDGHSLKYGYGRVNTLKAVQMAKAMLNTQPVITEPVVTAPNIPSILLSAQASAQLSSAGDFKLHGLNVGKQLIIQAKAMQGGMDLDLYYRKGAAPDLVKGLFDKKSASQQDMEFVVDSDAAAGDYYILLHAKSGQGQFGLQCTLGGVVPIDPSVKVLPMRMQSFNKGELSKPGSMQLFKLRIGQSLNVSLDAQGDTTTDFDLFLRKGAVPEPATQTFDASSSKLDSAKEAIKVQSAEIHGNYFVMVRSGKGAGTYNLKVVLE
jgi:hypothetical protein